MRSSIILPSIVFVLGLAACSTAPATGPTGVTDTGAEPIDSGVAPSDTAPPIDTGTSCKPVCSGFECGPDGCGGSCGTCAKGFTCDGARLCSLDSAAVWEIRFIDGAVDSEKKPDGTSWDALGGAPDPFVCVTLSGDTKPRCSTAPSDTFKPVWNYSAGSVTAGVAKLGFDVGLYDDDSPASPDVIGTSGHIDVLLSNFKTGVVDITWKGYGAARLTLTPK